MSDTPQDQYRIVVGFDGSEGAKRALTWAADEARAHGGRLRAVYAWRPGEFGSEEEQVAIAKKRIDEGIAEVLGESSGVNFETVSEPGHAAKVLLDNAGDAQMLVVGSRGHGGFTGLLLGSVGQHVATHSETPVVVIVRP
jgi:nucleotide-binding universal stress UspA family protein